MRTVRTSLVGMALGLAVLAGCQAIRSQPSQHAPAPPLFPWGNSSKTEPRKNSLLKSWFGAKEPAPPQSLKEWMDLEPIRP